MLHHNIKNLGQISKNSSYKTCFVVDVDFIFLETCFFTEVIRSEIFYKEIELTLFLLGEGGGPNAPPPPVFCINQKVLV